MTYKGIKVIIPQKVIIVQGTRAFKNASLIMQKLINALSILSFVLISSSLLAAGLTYRHIKSDAFKERIMSEVMKGVGNLVPDSINDALRDRTGLPIPLPPAPQKPF